MLRGDLDDLDSLRAAPPTPTPSSTSPTSTTGPTPRTPTGPSATRSRPSATRWPGRPAVRRRHRPGRPGRRAGPAPRTTRARHGRSPAAAARTCARVRRPRRAGHQRAVRPDRARRRRPGLRRLLAPAARRHGVSGYIGDGDALVGGAPLRRRPADPPRPREPPRARLHAVAEEGVPTREIAEAIGARSACPSGRSPPRTPRRTSACSAGSSPWTCRPPAPYPRAARLDTERPDPGRGHPRRRLHGDGLRPRECSGSPGRPISLTWAAGPSLEVDVAGLRPGRGLPAVPSSAPTARRRGSAASAGGDELPEPLVEERVERRDDHRRAEAEPERRTRGRRSGTAR